MSSMTVFRSHTPKNDLRELLSFVCDSKTDNLILYTIVKDTISAKELKEIADVQKDFSKDRKLVYKNHLVVFGGHKFSPKAKKVIASLNFSVEFALGKDYENYAESAIKEIRFLSRMGVPTRAWFDVPENQQEVYTHYKSKGMGVHFYHPQYDETGIQWFDRWLQDPAATVVNTFTDIISMLTLQLRSHNCRHGSCLGNTVYQAEDGVLYLCPMEQSEATCLGTPGKTTLQQMYASQGTYQTVLSSVEKRKTCLTACKDFAYCQGGCPLEGADCSHASYLRLLHHIRSRLAEIYEGGDLDVANNVVKNAILNAIAFGTAFFNDGRKENTHGEN